MTTAPKDSQQSPSISQHTNTTGVSSVVISLITGPFLITLMGVRTLADTLEQVGIVSEEVFRGVRLPTLTTWPANEITDMIDSDDE